VSGCVLRGCRVAGGALRGRVGLAAVTTAALTVLVLATAGGVAAAQGLVAPLSVEAIVRSVILAPSVIDYEGTKVISTSRGGVAETITLQELHKRPNKLRLQVLTPEEAAGRLVVDNGVEAWHYEPALHTAFQGPSLTRQPHDPERALRDLRAGYRMTVEGIEEVLGRPTFVVALAHRRGGMVRRLWVDQAIGTPLRVEERRAGEVVYLAYFTRISFSLNLPEALFRFRAPAGARIFPLFPEEERLAPLGVVERQAGFPILRPGPPPAGWRLRGAALVRYGSVSGVHLRYEGGAGPVSLFQVPARRLAVHDFQAGRAVRHGARTYRVLEVGPFLLVTWEARGLRLVVAGSAPLPILLDLAARVGG